MIAATAFAESPLSADVVVVVSSGFESAVVVVVVVDSAKAVAAITAQIDGKVSSYEYRTEDAGFMYYYVFTEDGHGYSAAYNKADGSVVLVQSY